MLCPTKGSYVECFYSTRHLDDKLGIGSSLCLYTKRYAALAEPAEEAKLTSTMFGTFSQLNPEVLLRYAKHSCTYMACIMIL